MLCKWKVADCSNSLWICISLYYFILTLNQHFVLVCSSSLKKVAVVTGGNKGIGYAIVEGLCQNFSGDVFLTARDEGRGLAAVKALNEMGYHPKFHQLDITDDQSIIKFNNYLLHEYGGLDVLINNAGIAFKVAATDPLAVQAKETIRVNYFGTRKVCDVMFPILRPHARVVHLSSTLNYCHLLKIPSELLRKKLSAGNLTVDHLDGLMLDFVRSAEQDKEVHLHWAGASAYSVSKVGISALTRIQQREFLNNKRMDIVVNSVHPGYVDTDMTSHKGTLTIAQGAVSSLYAALLPENITEPKGAHILQNKTIVDWTTPF
ncbi:carbonyl reductase [NADPH] 3-like isoform X2 [Planococcus citri]|uniref:carbonyl reductase [NADPH] 3-like isoform X2 n=1 Tax=Planococcus citri TaxID=170843 RepID=UPI0031FA2293